MKKFNVMLSLVAIVASVLFVSCAQKKTPDVVPAFPTLVTATISAEADHSWKIEPNMDWTASLVGDASEYIAFRVGEDGYAGYDDSKYYNTTTTEGERGYNYLKVRVINTPAYGTEAVECSVALTMGGETMTIATFTIEPSTEPEPTPEPEQPGEGGEENTDPEV